MSNWTKGPWTVEVDTGDRFYSEHHIESSEGMVAIVDGGNYGAWRDSEDEGKQEFEANAHLISSAPDLYEALEGILAITDRDHVAWDKAHAAMEKARGELV